MLYKSKKGKDKVSREAVDDATRMMQEAYAKKKKKEGYTVEEIFNGEADTELNNDTDEQQSRIIGT